VTVLAPAPVLLALLIASARPPAADGELERAVARMEQRDYAGALRILQELAEGRAPEPVVLYQIGVCQTVLGRFAEALASLERAQTAGLEGPEISGALGIARFNLGDNAGARAAFDRVVAQRPTEPTALLYLGRLDLKERRYVEAEQRLRHVLAAEPANEGALFALGRSLVLQGRSAEGKRVLEAHRKLSFLDDRIKTLRELAGGPQATGSTLAALGDAYLEAGDRMRALEAYSRAEQLEPGTRETALGRGKASYQAGEFEAAERLFDRAASDPGRKCEAGLYLGLSLRELKRTDAARTALEAAAGDCPPDTRVLANLGELEIQRRNLDRALELSQAIARLDASAPAGPYLAAVCKLYRKDLDGAEQAALEASRLDPLDPEYHRLLRAIYTAKGEPEKARRHEVEMETLLGKRRVNP
jgi:tetratricopeptide (TPR) repeat protein